MSRSESQHDLTLDVPQQHDDHGTSGSALKSPSSNDDSFAPGLAHIETADGRREAWMRDDDGEFLLDAALQATIALTASEQQRFSTFLSAPIDTPHQAAIAFAQFCEMLGIDAHNLAAHERSHLISGAIAQIDRLLNDQVNEILHHPRFQKLEASWCGLKSLVDEVYAESKKSIRIRMLNVSWSELRSDLIENSIEFDQSQLFRKVYEEEFGMPGGEPFGALIGDYEITNSLEDMETLQEVAGVAAAAFAPFVAGAAPSLLDLDRFADLDRPRDISAPFSQSQFVKWRSLRESEDARFIGLTLPRMLMRRPYEQDARYPDESTRRVRVDGFCFREQVADRDARRYLWGSAGYAFGRVIVRAFQQTGWLADICGVRRDELGGGIVPGPSHAVSSSNHLAAKPITEVIIPDDLEHELTELGFMPICHCHDTGDAAFYATPSIQRPKQYDNEEATANAKISSMLQHILCASRFAHFIKVIMRDRIGSYASAEEIQNALNRWLNNYVRDDDEAAVDIKARYPLRRAEVRVQPHPHDPSKYFCEIFLAPHYQLDALNATVRLTTEMKEQQ